MTDVPAMTMPEARLSDALEKMRKEDVAIFPVVKTDEDRHLLGMLKHMGIGQTLSKEIVRRRREET